MSYKKFELINGNPSSKAIDYLLEQMYDVFVRDNFVIINPDEDRIPEKYEKGVEISFGALLTYSLPDSKFTIRGEYVNYIDIGSEMAKILGFFGVIRFIYWAHENPNIWGNYSGLSIFNGKCFFNNKGLFGCFRSPEPKDIYRHFLGLRHRLASIEID